jgi:hypothetical protein
VLICLCWIFSAESSKCCRSSTGITVRFTSICKNIGLKYHPLWDEGYLSVGDTHTTRKWEPGMAEEDTRFFGLKRECGLHEG